jgi:hypothetical protein
MEEDGLRAGELRHLVDGLHLLGWPVRCGGVWGAAAEPAPWPPLRPKDRKLMDARISLPSLTAEG